MNKEKIKAWWDRAREVAGFIAALATIVAVILGLLGYAIGRHKEIINSTPVFDVTATNIYEKGKLTDIDLLVNAYTNYQDIIGNTYFRDLTIGISLYDHEGNRLARSEDIVFSLNRSIGISELEFKSEIVNLQLLINNTRKIVWVIHYEIPSAWYWFTDMQGDPPGSVIIE
ncbi:MAG: hypothetical protein GY771_12445 [bacterium]|nr:hypothetical protein [bacterium]